MGDVRVLEPDDERAELRQAQPLWYLPFQDAALTVTRTRAFTGDHQHQAARRGNSPCAETAIRLRALRPASAHAGQAGRQSLPCRVRHAASSGGQAGQAASVFDPPVTAVLAAASWQRVSAGPSRSPTLHHRRIHWIRATARSIWSRWSTARVLPQKERDAACRRRSS